MSVTQRTCRASSTLRPRKPAHTPSSHRPNWPPGRPSAPTAPYEPTARAVCGAVVFHWQFQRAARARAFYAKPTPPVASDAVVRSTSSPTLSHDAARRRTNRVGSNVGLRPSQPETTTIKQHVARPLASYLCSSAPVRRWARAAPPTRCSHRARHAGGLQPPCAGSATEWSGPIRSEPLHGKSAGRK